MLRELTINNFATIENLTIQFGEGLNILTGETGAGKSIIIDALNLALGGRADNHFIRTGQKICFVEALFETDNPETIQRIHELGVEIENGQLIIKRTLSVNGKNRTHLNGSNITVSTLAYVGDSLADIHGQHDHQTLLHPELHVDLLDAHGRLLGDRSKLEKQYIEYHRVLSEFNQTQSNEFERFQKKDLLNFQIAEIENANLSIADETHLKKEQACLANAEKIKTGIEKVLALLMDNDDSIAEGLGIVSQELEQIRDYNDNLNKKSEQMQSILFETEDLVSGLRDCFHLTEFNPNRLEEIEDRLAEMNQLKRKYGNKGVSEILEYLDIAKKELKTLSQNLTRIDYLKEKLAQQEKSLGQLASQLAKKREAAAKELGKKAARELKDLEMSKAQLETSFSYDSGGFVSYQGKEVKLGPKGIGTVEFLFSANLGEEARPLAKIASGGELARVMLALKTILNQQDTIPSLVFDEVDSGVGGAVAEKIGRKLKFLSTNKQVFCITHLPQIAGMATSHYLIEKKTKDNRTNTFIRKLNSKERLEEIARMSGGTKITEVTRKHAKEMLKI